MQGHTGKHQGQSGSRGMEEKEGTGAFIVIWGYGKAGDAGPASAGFRNFNGFKATATVPTCLALE